jgi:hypothetical protein
MKTKLEQMKTESVQAQLEYERLEILLKEKNCAFIKTHKKMYLRSFFKMFGKDNLAKFQGDWPTKLIAI